MKIEKTIVIICTLAILAGCCTSRGNIQKEPEYSLDINDLKVRDPFIFANIADSTYYLHANSGRNSIICYSSKDLKMWKLCGESFVPQEDFWGTKDFWAPDLYYYKGHYYMFVTFSSDKQKRGVSILMSDRPDGDFKPIINEPVTDKEWMCLDGSLYVDKHGNPWMIYCREWVEVGDGEIWAQPMLPDLSGMAGQPVFLFKGSSASWAGLITSGARTGIVTNSPFVITTDDGKLLMIWSSFLKNGEYAIGSAVSSSGNIAGPWENSEEALNDDGGHAMFFHTFDGRMLMSYHTNELPERIVLRPVHIVDGRVMLLN